MFDPLHSLRQNVRRRARLRIVPYCSIGTLDSVVFRGRVLANPVLPTAGPDQRALASVARMVSRFTTFEVESIPVVVRVGDTEREGVTDREGYFNIDMPIESFDDTQHWIKADAFMPGRRLIAGGDELLWPIEARIVGPHTRRIVISDIDDTLLLNGVGDTTRTIVETIRGSYLTREPVPDTAELYQWLTAGGSHPIAYVSSSPWNLYDFLTLFMEHHGFPKGPLFLRDFGFNRATFGGAHGQHKVAAIQQVLDLCPAADVILLGDSSQQDAEAFNTVIETNPSRNVRAYIRDVGDSQKAERVRDIGSLLASSRERTRSLALIQSPAQIRHDLADTDWL